jgi:hypothetical protein
MMMFACLFMVVRKMNIVRLVGGNS